TVDMGSAESAEVDAGAVDAQARLGVVEEMPAPTEFCRLRGRSVECADERLDVAIGFDPVLDLGRRWQLRRRLLRLRGEEVVGPEDEDTGDVDQFVEDVEHTRDDIGREVVTGVDDEVGVESGQSLDPGGAMLLPGSQVQVGDVEDPDGCGTG